MTVGIDQLGPVDPPDHTLRRLAGVAGDPPQSGRAEMGCGR